MQIFRFSILIFLFLVPAVKLANAANESYHAGARNTAMSYSDVESPDHWASFYNQAGLARAESFSLGIYTESRYSMEGVNFGGFAAVFPDERLGTFALNGLYFGHEHYYREQRAGLAYARALGEKVYAGIQFNVFNTAVYGYENTWYVNGEAGILIKASDGLFVGIHVYNPTAQKMAEYQNERQPMVYTGGLSWYLSDKIKVAASARKDMLNPVQLLSGIDYRFHEYFSLQAGIGSAPMTNTFGIGFHYGSIRFNFAVSLDYQLGLSPHLSLDYFSL
jgi:hypothetical protein